MRRGRLKPTWGAHGSKRLSDFASAFLDRACVLARLKGLRFASPALRAAPPAPLTRAARADVSAAAAKAERRGQKMLQIYSVALDWIERIEPLIARIARGDRELGDATTARERVGGLESR